MRLCAISSRAMTTYARSMLVPLLLLAFGSDQPRAADPVAELSKGSALYRVCQAEVRVMDLPSVNEASQSDLLDGSYCIGYLNGFTANLEQQTTICTQSAPMSSLIRAYVDFLKKHPDFLAKDRRLGLGLALEKSFPCPVRPGLEMGHTGVSRVAFR